MEIIHRPRRLRQNNSIREILAETKITPESLMLPIFVTEGKNLKTPIKHLPNNLVMSVDEMLAFLKEQSPKLKSVLLFGVSSKRDAKGSEALNRESPVCRAISEIRSAFPELNIATDIALDPYTDHGHDGLFENGKILNDESVQVLSEMALIHARAGAHIVAPSDMMDGRVSAIRSVLDADSFTDTLILSYTAKYASCLYGPFRDALGSEVFGDKKTYQMDPRNRREALRELELDIEEGADMVMVKPALQYLDVIADFKERSPVPVAAYHVSGECAMLELGAKQGLFDRERAILEALTSITRAGADLIATYYAAEILNSDLL